ncbi:MAG: hypothetical protein V1668_02440 [Patescibacteria group bacterium]
MNVMIIPVTPNKRWYLERRDGLIELGTHWPLQETSNFGGYVNGEPCTGPFYLIFNGPGDSSEIRLHCEKCNLHLQEKTHKNRFGALDVKELKLALARLMFVCARHGNKINPPIQFPCLSLGDRRNHMHADIPLLDTGFSTPDEQPIHLGLFLPRRTGYWDPKKGKWVPEETYDNLAESTALLIAELLNNSRSLELANKRTIGR